MFPMNESFSSGMLEYISISNMGSRCESLLNVILEATFRLYLTAFARVSLFESIFDISRFRAGARLLVVRPHRETRTYRLIFMSGERHNMISLPPSVTVKIMFPVENNSNFPKSVKTRVIWVQGFLSFWESSLYKKISIFLKKKFWYGRYASQLCLVRVHGLKFSAFFRALALSFCGSGHYLARSFLLSCM